MYSASQGLDLLDLSSVADLIHTACGSACAGGLASTFCLVQWISQCRFRTPERHRKNAEQSGPERRKRAPEASKTGSRGFGKATRKGPETPNRPKRAPGNPSQPLPDHLRAASGTPGRPKRAPRAPRGGPRWPEEGPRQGPEGGRKGRRNDLGRKTEIVLPLQRERDF